MEQQKVISKSVRKLKTGGFVNRANIFTLGFLIGLVVCNAIWFFSIDLHIQKFSNQKFFECVDSVKIPVGECSRLFKGEK